MPFLDGVRVGDLSLGGKATMLATPGLGGLPQVLSFDAATQTLLSSLFAPPQTFGGGLFVAGG
jgi:hypothetical protein